MDKVLKNIIGVLGTDRGAKKALLDYLELPSSTFGDWQSGRNKSYMKRLPQIARYFNVSVDTLLSDSDDVIDNDDDMDTLDKITELLRLKGYTQKDLCDYLKIKQQVYTDWKSGRNKSYTKHLPQIAEFFGVSVDYLLGREDTKKDEPSGSPVVIGYNSGRYRVGIDNPPKRPIDLAKEIKPIQNSQEQYSNLSAYEKYILEIFRSLDINGQAKLITLIHDFAEQS